MPPNDPDNPTGENPEVTDDIIEHVPESIDELSKPTIIEKIKDLEKVTPQEKRIDKNTVKWAKNVKPLAWFILITLSLVFLIPFGIYAGELFTAADAAGKEKMLDKISDWGSNILPVITALAGTVVGYFFKSNSD